MTDSSQGRAEDLSSWFCIYTVLEAVQRPGLYSAAYGSVHYKEPLKSFGIRRSLIVIGSITEVRRRRARFIIGWVTAW